MSQVRFELNGERAEADLEPRHTLAEVLRSEFDCTGTHLGCEHGVCGACTVHLDGVPVRSCLMLAVQVDDHRVTTVEGLADGDDLHVVQEAFLRYRGFQCGFCTPGMQMAVAGMILAGRPLSRDDIVHGLSSHVCRCTGYAAIIDAACDALRTSGLLIEEASR